MNISKFHNINTSVFNENANRVVSNLLRRLCFVSEIFLTGNVNKIY